MTVSSPPHTIIVTSYLTINSIIPTVISSTVTLNAAQASSKPDAALQGESANSITIEYIGTLPISPLIFSAIVFGAGLMVMLVFSLVCCRGGSGRRSKDEEYDPMGLNTTAMNTTSQRTFTNTSNSR